MVVTNDFYKLLLKLETAPSQGMERGSRGGLERPTSLFLTFFAPVFDFAQHDKCLTNKLYYLSPYPSLSQPIIGVICYPPPPTPLSIS